MTESVQAAAPTAAEVVGTGVLATALRHALTACRSGDDNPPTPVRFVVSDSWEERDSPAETARIGVHTELGRVVLGPLEVPGRGGCGACVRWRRRQARDHRDAFDALVEAHRHELVSRSSAWLTAEVAATVGALAADEYVRFASGRPPRTENAVLMVDLAELTVSRHPYLPDTCCLVCGRLPDDAPDSAAVACVPRYKLAPDVHRTRVVKNDLEQLKATYVDPETGLIPRLFRGGMGGLAVATAPLRILEHTERRELGIGRTRDYRSSELVAILEALERLGGVRPGGKRTTVRASYAELAATEPEAVLDPRTTGLHPQASYDRPGFPYRRFTESEVCDWVWGYSLTRSRPVLVPETLAYYRLEHRTWEQRGFCYEISNGCALGSNVEEAAAHGLLEVIERDAFLLTWYARLPVPRFDLDSATDPQVRLTAAAIRAETGWDVRVFDTTMEHGIPSAWALATGPRDTWPKAACSAGSGFDPQTAVLNALSELGLVVHALKGRDPAETRRAEHMLHDPAQVAAMDDHSVLYAHPAALDRLGFLTGGVRTRPLPAAGDPAFRHQDLSDDLRAAVRCLHDAGMDVIVVDQTTGEHRAAGLSCVKVLVPGAVPMTFGHHNRRVHGLHRLLRVPRSLGHGAGASDWDRLNPHPHPFP